jgi:hypothetical protein
MSYRAAPAMYAATPAQETGMTQTRFTCSLTKADEPACQSYARVTIVDCEGATARGCPRHAVAALDGITGAHVDWADSKGLNEWERKALELSEERSKLGDGISFAKTRIGAPFQTDYCPRPLRARGKVGSDLQLWCPSAKKRDP